MTLSELFETRYLPSIQKTLKPKTVSEYTRLYQATIKPVLGDRTIAGITMDDAERVHQFTAGNVQANRTLALLSTVMGYAVQRRLLGHNPCRGIRRNKEKGREFFYTPAQTRKLLAAASASPDIQHKYIALELLTGCRPGELLDSSPAWRHGSVLRTPDGKTGSRTIFLPDEACAILDSLQPVTRLVTEWPNPTPVSRECYFPEISLRRAWERLCKQADVPRARLYDLRHTFASAALAAGESLPVIGQLLGHRKAQTTLRYAHLDPEVGLEAAIRTAKRMGAK
jgi:integrase